MPALQRDAADYEALRSAALRGDGRALLLRGLAAWLTAPPAPPRPPVPSAAAGADGASCCGSLPATFAAIVLRLTQELAHA